MPWGADRVELYYGEVPIGEGLERLVLRKGVIRQLLPGGKIGGPGTHEYFEVCTNPRVFDLIETQLGGPRKN